MCAVDHQTFICNRDIVFFCNCIQIFVQTKINVSLKTDSFKHRLSRYSSFGLLRSLSIRATWTTQADRFHRGQGGIGQAMRQRHGHRIRTTVFLSKSPSNWMEPFQTSQWDSDGVRNRCLTFCGCIKVLRCDFRCTEKRRLGEASMRVQKEQSDCENVRLLSEILKS